LDSYDKKEILSLANLFGSLSEILKALAEKGGIETQLHHLANENLKEVLRFEKDQNKALLMKSADNRQISVVSDFIYSLSAAINEYCDKHVIGMNKQTDLKTKMRELLSLKQ